MIPYFQLTHFNLGPVVIQVWGLCVAIGIMAAVLYMRYLANKQVLSVEVIVDMAIWILISAFIWARVFYVAFYNLAFYLANPASVFKFWEGGMSSLGGFFGAGLAIWIFAKRRKFKWSELLPYFDIMAVGLWLGWGIGRVGCFLIHDHPGTLSHFMLAVKYPGGARFDLGLMESILGFLLFGIFALLFSRLTKIRSGLVVGWSVACYAVARFFLDFLRATDLPGSDVRYGGLTPAQWGMLTVVAVLTFKLIYDRMGRVNEK